MNLRRILQGITLFCLMAFSVNQAQCQTTQLAAINQDGLIQLGSNHPFVVEKYNIDLSGLGLNSVADAKGLFHKYIDEGFAFIFDMTPSAENATMTINIRQMYDVSSVPVAEFNKALRGIHKIRE